MTWYLRFHYPYPYELFLIWTVPVWTIRFSDVISVLSSPSERIPRNGTLIGASDHSRCPGSRKTGQLWWKLDPQTKLDSVLSFAGSYITRGGSASLLSLACKPTHFKRIKEVSIILKSYDTQWKIHSDNDVTRRNWKACSTYSPRAECYLWIVLSHMTCVSW